MLISQISVFVENRTGSILEVSGVLRDAGINICALSIADTSDFGILRLIVNEPGKAEKALKENGVTVLKTDVLAIEMENRPGSFHNVLKVLADAGLSLEYTYAFVTPIQGRACVILRVEDNEKAMEAFKKAGVRLLSFKEICGTPD